MDTLFCTGIYKDGYGIISKKVMRDKNLSISAKALYAYICSFAGAGGEAFPSLDLICGELGISEKKIYQLRKELVENGLITISKKRVGSKYSNNVYTIVNDPKYDEKNKDEPSKNERVQNEPSNFERVHSEPCPNVGTISNSFISNNNNKKENKKKKAEAVDSKTEFDELISNYTSDNSVRETLYEFIKFRKTIKAQLTTLGLKKILNKLSQLAKTDKEKIAILENSIMNGWRGIFPLKQQGGINYATGNNRIFSTGQNISTSKYDIKQDEWKGLTEEEYKRAEAEGLI